MATARDYNVTFGYRATDGYYYGPGGRVGPYHRGNDRPCPSGTRIEISGVLIGLTGATGLVSGPHLHTQACTAGSNYADDFDPAPFEFKNGLVVVAGWHSQFGNRVVIRVGGVDITYAHLSQINVAVGQQIGASEVANAEQVKNLYRGVLRREADPGGLANYTGRDANQIVAEMLGSQEKRNLDNYINSLATGVADRDRIIADLRTALTNEQNKPAKEVIKEVEKIVEVPVEKVVEVPKTVEVVKEVNPTWLENAIQFVRKVLRIKE